MERRDCAGPEGGGGGADGLVDFCGIAWLNCACVVARDSTEASVAGSTSGGLISKSPRGEMQIFARIKVANVASAPSRVIALLSP